MKITRHRFLQQTATASPGLMLHGATAGRIGRNFYGAMAVIAALAVIGGFSLTYVFPMMVGKFHAQPIVHVHGALFFSWILLFFTQAVLVRTGRIALHRTLGVAGGLLAGLMLIVGVYVALASATRGVASGNGAFARYFLIIPLTDMLLFAVLVGFGLAYRRRPQTHKRLMLLATVSLLPAAFARLFAFMGGGFAPMTIATDLFLVAGITHDLLTRGRIHRAYLWGGAFMVAVHVIRLPMGSSRVWLGIADLILRLM